MNVLIHEDGTEEDLLPADGKSFELKELYAALDCSIVQCLWGKDVCFVMDEELLMKDRPMPNRKATFKLWEMLPEHKNWTFLHGKIGIIDRNHFD